MKRSLKFLLFLMMLVGVDSSAFENEIVIKGVVSDEVAIEVLHLSRDRDGLYLHSNSKAGATVIVDNLTHTKKQKMYQNGKLRTLPIIHDLFDGPFVLGGSLLDINEQPIIIIDVKAH